MNYENKVRELQTLLSTEKKIVWIVLVHSRNCRLFGLAVVGEVIVAKMIFELQQFVC